MRATSTFMKLCAIAAVTAVIMTACGANGDDAAPAPPTSTTPTARVTSVVPEPSNPVRTVHLVCGGASEDSDESVDLNPFTVFLNEDGTADFDDLWSRELACDSTFYQGEPVEEFLPVTTPLQENVIRVAKESGYADGTPDDASLLYSIYQHCGSNDPTDYYATDDEFSEAQTSELTTWLTLCPNHPQADRWTKGMAAGAAAKKAEKEGRRVYDGTYKVPAEIQRGRFVVKDVEDCYWETRDNSGKVIDNDFVVSAPRVEVTIGDDAVAFTARGCGEWNRQ